MSTRPKKGDVHKIPSDKERRTHHRILVNIWVREERSDFYYLYKATDISEGGMFLEKKMEVPDCKALSTFKFTLPKSSRLITAEGMVVFSNTSNKSNRPGSGVKFTHISHQDKKLITKYVHFK